MEWRAFIVLGLMAAAGSEQPGSGLRAGTVLTYESAGQRSDWRIDSVRVDSVPQCGVVWSTRGGSSERRHHCSDGVVLSEQQRDGSWSAVRPVAAGLERSVRRPSGNLVTYRTTTTAIDTIGGTGYPVILTEVTTADATGRVVQRLRERYSVALTTATWGVFERPDSTSGQLKQTSEFRLVKVIHP